MIRPAAFGFNPETAVNNVFQVNSGNTEDISKEAIKEFDGFVDILTKNEIDVVVYQDTIQPHTPDAVFPNNWVSFHEDGTCCIYPMFAENRRNERSKQVLELVKQKFQLTKIIDFTYLEDEMLFIEGTGSMVLDRENKIMYACISPRTSLKALYTFCDTMNYTAVHFNAFGINGIPVYHTNVMMSVAGDYVIACIDAINNPEEKKFITKAIHLTDKKLIEISVEQMNCFAGNMLQVINNKNEKILIMSKQAYESLTQQQIRELETFNSIVYANLKTIETNGGGSARCMMAEIFLPLK
jgi:hypothetical protein